MSRYNNDTSEEEYPDALPDPSTLSKRWIWKEDTGSLEQVSTGMSLGDKIALNLTKAKKNKPGNNLRFPDMQKMNQKVNKKNPAIFGKQTKNSTSPRPSTKINRDEKRIITLNDVKNVAFDLLSDDVIEVPEAFEKNFFRKEQFDNFLMALLYYFEAYFERRNLENKPRPMATEPSVAEKQAIAYVINRQTAAQRLLASKYCTLILGLGNQQQHHMVCGRQRKSYTRKDRSLYEAIYTFSSYTVWVCFRRKDMELITTELGRLFRSDTFNPASRPAVSNDFKLAADLTKEEDPDFNLAPYSVRQRQKRPAIKSIVNQRSPVLVSLLPTSKEASPWLLDRRKGLVEALGEAQRDEEEQSRDVPLSIGIIGENMSAFNSLTLAPFGEDHDDDDENQRPYSTNSSQDEKATEPTAEQEMTEEKDDDM